MLQRDGEGEGREGRDVMSDGCDDPEAARWAHRAFLRLGRSAREDEEEGRRDIIRVRDVTIVTGQRGGI